MNQPSSQLTPDYLDGPPAADISAPAFSSPAPRSASSSPLIAPWPHVWAVLLALAAVGASAGQILAGPSTHVGFFLPALAFVVCLLAAWFDAATGRIPNPLTYTAILLGLALNLFPALFSSLSAFSIPHSAFVSWLGATTPRDALWGFALGAAVGLVCLIFARMGGGDMKLIVALSALLGLKQAGPVLLWALAVALPYALFNLLFFGRLNAALRSASIQLLSWIYLHKPGPLTPISRSTIPLAVPLLAGLILARAFPGVLL